MITWINFSKIIAILAVVFIHVSSNYLDETSVGTNGWLTANFYDTISRWAVPVFVMVSGFLLLNSSKNETILEFYKKRISKIGLALLFWTFFYLALKYAINMHKENSINYLNLLLIGEPYYHLWFLYMIAGLYLFTPFFRIVVKYLSQMELLYLTIALFIISVANDLYQTFYIHDDKMLFVNLFLMYIGYYFMGNYIQRDTRNYSYKLLMMVVISSMAVTFFMTYYMSSHYSENIIRYYFYGNLSITVIPMSIALMYLFKEIQLNKFSKFINHLSVIVFGIYLVHPLILGLISRLAPNIKFLNPLFSIPFIAIMVFVLSALVTYIMSKNKFLKKII